MTEQLENSAPEIGRACGPREWAVRTDLAAFYHLIAHFGWDELIYNHISARVPGEDEHFLLNPFGFTFDEVTASSLVKIDLDGNIVEPTPHRFHRAGFVIHSAIHAARPDLTCIIHSHTRASVAISMLKEGLLPLSQHAMLFHDKIGYHDSEGPAVHTDERERLAKNLGDGNVLILRNHGILVGGSTIPEAFSMMVHLEKAMGAQLDAMRSGSELNWPSDAAIRSTATGGFGADAPGFEDNKSPLGRAEWPAMLRLLGRVSPGYDR